MSGSTVSQCALSIPNEISKMLSQETILELMGKGSQHSGMSRLFQSFNQESYDGKGRGESHICEAPFLAMQLPL